HESGIDEVVVLAPDQKRIRERDHADGVALGLELLVAAEAVRGALELLRLGLAVAGRGHVALRRHAYVNARPERRPCARRVPTRGWWQSRASPRATSWRCTRTPPRRRRGCPGPPCAGPRSAPARARRRSARAGSRGPSAACGACP